MRTEDLNNDGESDCVGLHVQDLRIITDPRISVESLGKTLFRNGRNTLLDFILWKILEPLGLGVGMNLPEYVRCQVFGNSGYKFFQPLPPPKEMGK